MASPLRSDEAMLFIVQNHRPMLVGSDISIVRFRWGSRRASRR